MDLFAFRYLWVDNPTNDNVNTSQEDEVDASKDDDEANTPKEEVQESLLEAKGNLMDVFSKLRTFVDSNSNIRMANVKYARVQANTQAKLRNIQLDQSKENAAKTMSRVWSLFRPVKLNITEIVNTFLSINGITDADKGVLAALILDRLAGNLVDYTKYPYKPIQDANKRFKKLKKIDPEDVRNHKRGKKDKELLYPKEFLWINPDEEGKDNDKPFEDLINKYGKSNVGQFYYNITEVLPDISVDSFPIQAFKDYWEENGTLPKDFIRIIFKAFALKLFEKKTINNATITQGIKSGVLSGYDLIFNKSFYSSYEDAIFRAKTNFLFTDRERKTVLAAFSPEHLYDVAKNSGLNAYEEGEKIDKYPCYVLADDKGTLIYHKNAEDISGYNVHKGEESTSMITTNNVLYNNLRNSLLYSEWDKVKVPAEGVDDKLAKSWAGVELNTKSAIAAEMTQYQAKDYDSSGVANDLQHEDSEDGEDKYLKDSSKSLYDDLVAASNLSWSNVGRISIDNVKSSLQSVVSTIGTWMNIIQDEKKKNNRERKPAKEMKEYIQKKMGDKVLEYLSQANKKTGIEDDTDSSTKKSSTDSSTEAPIIQSRLSILLIAYVYSNFKSASVVALDNLSDNLKRSRNALQGAANGTAYDMSKRITDCFKHTDELGEIVQDLVGTEKKEDSKKAPTVNFLKTPGVIKKLKRKVKSKHKKK